MNRVNLDDMVRAEKRFWAKVNKAGPVAEHVKGIDECWVWTAGRNHGRMGYGVFGLEGTALKAHRIAWALAYGDIPEGIFVLHRCDNPQCVRPTHLFLGTHADNGRDKAEKGRARAPQGDQNYTRNHPEIVRGERNPNSKLKESDVVLAKEMLSSGASLKSIAERLKISVCTACEISMGKRWSHVPWPDGASFLIGFQASKSRPSFRRPA